MENKNNTTINKTDNKTDKNNANTETQSDSNKNIETFEDLNLNQYLLADLKKFGFIKPTMIQQKAIPYALEGRDIIGQAQTGTGKTAAFGIPILNKKSGKPGAPTALIMTPTRELANQVAKELQNLSRLSWIKVLAVYGGESIEKQIRVLRKGVHIVVGTPGRLLDHISRRTLKLHAITNVVLDEADEMLDMGFADDMEKILGMTPDTRQTMLFSATFSPEILKISKRYLTDPAIIRTSAENSVASKVKQIFYRIKHTERRRALKSLVEAQNERNDGVSIVFCQTKRDVDRVHQDLYDAGFESGALHGDYSQSKRDNVMRKFRSGRLQVLVATDVAARGIDVKNVRQVINYCVPKDPKSYIHRVGRTARIGSDGVAITLLTREEGKYIRPIEKLTKKRIMINNFPQYSLLNS